MQTWARNGSILRFKTSRMWHQKIKKRSPVSMTADKTWEHDGGWIGEAGLVRLALGSSQGRDCSCYIHNQYQTTQLIHWRKLSSVATLWRGYFVKLTQFVPRFQTYNEFWRQPMPYVVTWSPRSNGSTSTHAHLWRGLICNNVPTHGHNVFSLTMNVWIQ